MIITDVISDAWPTVFIRSFTTLINTPVYERW